MRLRIFGVWLQIIWIGITRRSVSCLRIHLAASESRRSKRQRSRIGFVIDDKRPSATDAQNALIVYDALKYLTPHQASIERLWAYLCHFDCRQYVAARWLNRRPDNEKDAVREVRNHFFASGNRALIRDNGVSRLWWLGKIAHDVAPDGPREFLTLLLHRQDVRSALIERPLRVDEPRTSPWNLRGNAGTLGQWWRTL